MQSSCLILRDRIGWFGKHTGYEQLPKYLPAHLRAQVVSRRPGQIVRYLGSCYGWLQRHPGQGARDFSELEFRLRRQLRPPDVSHVLYSEYHLNLLPNGGKMPRDVVGTFHQPKSQWTVDSLKQLARWSSAVVLYRRDMDFFEEHIGRNRVRFIHHGADIEFFRPTAASRVGPPRLLYSGVWLRDEPLVVRVILHLAKSHPELRFDLLVPEHHRPKSALQPLMGHPAVTWHAGLSDEQLRSLYQRAYLLLLPMTDSGANTTVVEALATGLPIVTTYVGGIRDYGGGTVFPLVAPGDEEAMVELVERHLEDAAPRVREEIGERIHRNRERAGADRRCAR